MKEVLEDAVKVIVDGANGSGDTGGFELCYKYKHHFQV